MLKLYNSNSAEQLADLLAAVTSRPMETPLATETVLVQHPAMGQWLSLALAKRLGICANVEFLLPAKFIWQIFRSLLKDVPSQYRYDPKVLGWRIFCLLEELDHSSQFDSVHSYLADGDELKRRDLAWSLGSIFDQYLVYRPDWITSWEKGQQAVVGDEWQAELWRRLISTDEGLHWVQLQQRLVAVLAKGTWPRGLLPERVSLFALPTLSPGYLEILHQLSKHIEVHLFLLNPCQEHWAEIIQEPEKLRRELEANNEELYLDVGNQLLASLGRQGRDLMAMVQACEPRALEAFQETGEKTLLHRVQSDILHLRDVEKVQGFLLSEDDRSIQIHSCHSPMREVEVLQDQLLFLFQSDPELQPGDVLVVTPDIDTYAPYIEAVFSAREGHSLIPYHIATSLTAQGQPLINAFLELLRLGHSRLDSNELMAFLEVSAIRRRFGIGEEDLGKIRRWIEQSGIRWGRDGGHRGQLGLPNEVQNSWRAGLDRLLLGYAMPGKGERMFQDILPYDEVEGGEAAVLGGLIDFVEGVFELRESLNCARPMDAWGGLLMKLLDHYFQPGSEQEVEVRQLKEGIHLLVEQAQLADCVQPMSCDLVRDQLASSVSTGYGASLVGRGGITFASLQSMRGLPYKAICLIGMDEGVFPRHCAAPGFDLMAIRFRSGDRVRRTDDRYLFLEALISAKQYFYLSYKGQDIRDNSLLPPSVLVDELLDYLGQCCDADEQQIRKRLATQHPLQPFSLRYFQPETGLKSFSRPMWEACEGMQGSDQPGQPFISQTLPEPEASWKVITLGQLARFFSNPTRYLLQQRLGVFLEEGEGLLEAREPFELSYFTQQECAQQILEAELEGGNPQQLRQRLRGAGVLPHGVIGDRLFEQLRLSSVEFARRLREHDQTTQLEPVAVDLVLGEMSLKGQLSKLTPEGIFDYSIHKVWDNQLFELWINHLVLNLLQPKGIGLYSLWLDAERLYQFVPVKGADELLHDLLDIYWQGLSRTLHLFPKSGRAYVQALLKGSDDIAALKKANAKWQGGYNQSGEYDNPYYKLVFSHDDVLDLSFQQLSERLFHPMLQHMEEVKA